MVARKILSINVISLIGIGLLLPLGVLSLKEGYPTSFWACNLVSLLLMANLVYLRFSGDHRWAGNAAVVIGAAYFSFIFVNGGVKDTGHLWTYLIPLMAMPILGRRLGALFCGGLAWLWLLMAVGFQGLPGVRYYQAGFLTRFLISFLMTSGLVYIIEVMRERTRGELAQSNQELSERESMYRSLVELANDGILLIKGRTILYSNPRVTQITGLAESEVVGRPFDRFIAPAELENVMAYYRRRMTGDREAHKYETILLSKEGSGVPVELNTRPIRYQGAAADLVILRDITGRKESQARRLAAERLQAAIETAGAACHELNQPLQALMAQAEIAQMQSEEGSELRQRMDGLVEQIQRMADITGRLSRITDYRTRDYLDHSQILDLDGSSPGQGQDDREPEI